jgi:hypothetical protein
MRNQLFMYAVLALVLAVSAVGSAEVLLNDTFADGDRTDTDLPNESGFWASSPGDVTTTAGNVRLGMADSSRRMHTYFAPAESPVSLSVGETLIATIDFIPEVGFVSSESSNFRMGLFYDPVQMAQDSVGDSGIDNGWHDATGYSVTFGLSDTETVAKAQCGKRTATEGTNSLLGTDGAYTYAGSGTGAGGLSLNTVYTITMTLDYQAADLMEVSFKFSQGDTVIASCSLTDDGAFGGKPIYTNFDFLMFRLSKAEGTAEVVNFQRIKIEKIDASVPQTGCSGVGILHTTYAVQSCRTDIQKPDENQHNSTKLSVRAHDGDGKSAKSWIKFEVSGFDPNSIKTATLRVALQAGKAGAQAFDVSAVNDDCRTNISWDERSLTWNNAPGNNGDDLRLLDPALTTKMATVSFTDGVENQQFEIDVLEAVRQDTDGILQFVLHKSENLLEFSTHDHPLESNRPVLYILEAPAGADYPSVCPGATVSTDLAGLSWTNPDPNDGVSPIVCTVYFGTDPNRLLMANVTLDPDENSVLISQFGVLQNKTTYYWAVDCEDMSPGAGVIPGMMWSFYVNNNEPPVVNAGSDQAVWLGKSGTPGQETVTLAGSVDDDELPLDPGITTLQWTQVPTDAPTVVIDSDTTETASVTFTQRGDYQFMLTADDGEGPVSDTVRIVVGIDACDASHLQSGANYYSGDFDKNCIIDLNDLLVVAANWLDCTDTITNCAP